MKRAVRGVLALLLVLSTLAMASPASAGSPVGGSISGTVTEDGTGDPVAGAWVLVELCETSVIGSTPFEDCFIEGFAETAGDGTYTATGLPAGDYRVSVSAPGYEDGCYDACALFALAADEVATGIDVALVEIPGGSISGTVTDEETGDPLWEAHVYACDDSFDCAEAYTSETGAYTIDGLLPGDYDVYFDTWGYQGECYDGDPTYTACDWVTVGADEDVAGVDASLVPDSFGWGSISGTVTDEETALPIAGVDVSTCSYFTCEYDTTAADGTYMLDPLPADDYVVYFDGAPFYSAECFEDDPTYVSCTPVPVAETEDVTGVDASLVPLDIPGGSISGTVTDEETGDPLDWATVTACPVDGFGLCQSGQSGPDGSYTVGALEAGDYEVTFWALDHRQECFDDQLSGSCDPVTVVEDQNTPDIDAALWLSVRPCEPGAPATGLTNVGFETGDLTAWATGTVTEEVVVTGADAFTAPYEGTKMARLGASSDGTSSQQPGPNVICQDFVVDEATEQFVYNIFTYDYTGFDEFDFVARVVDPDTGEVLAAETQGAWGVGTALKSSGWRGVEMDLADHLGETVRVQIEAGGTLDSALPFWAYVDSAESGLPPEVSSIIEVGNTDASVMVDPVTGQVTVAMPFASVDDLPFSVSPECPDGSAPTAVSLLLNGTEFVMTEDGGVWSVTIPESEVESGVLSLQMACEGSTAEIVTVVGSIQLYDPSGYLTDADTSLPVEGAAVTLFQVPGWTAATEAGDLGPTECQSNLSKDPGDPWSQPAPTGEGVEANPFSGLIDPAVNPFISNAEGYYGWDVAAGCWYVIVQAEGYELLVSPVVGVPPEVTDLDLELTPTETTTVPGAPTGVSGVAGAGEVTVSWDVPADNGGSPITEYTVTASPGGATCTSATTSCVVDGLINGTAYTFTVVATNDVGDGPASEPSAAVTPMTVPGAPTAVAGVSGAGQVAVSWTAPADDGGSAITGYTVTAAPGGATCTTATTSCAVTGLTNGTAYTFTVVATNEVGDGPASEESDEVTPMTVPGAPTAVAGVSGAGQVAVSWTAPADDGGSDITGYTVTAAPGGATCTTATTSCAVTGLTNGTAYTFTVVATNEVGDGPASAPSAAVTPMTVPGAPTAVLGTAGAGQVSVSWTAPASNGGSPITGYTVTANPGGATCTTATTSCAVTGLTNGTAYTFTVVATNSVGDSAASAPSAAVTPRTVPGAPTAATGVADNGQVTVSWTAPASNGGSPITGYTVTATPGGATCTSASTSCAVTGLTNGASYTFTVVATNAVGTGPISAPSAAVTPTTCGAGAGAGPFPDVPKSSGFCGDIEWLVAEEVTGGFTDGTFKPTLAISRQSMAAFLYRYAGSPDGEDPACTTAPFPDVPVSNPFCGEIEWMVAEGITGGFGDGTFRPTLAISRQSMAGFLYRFAESPDGDDPACTTAPFPDVPTTNPFCGEIEWMVAEDITGGFGDGTFRPRNPVSRQGMAAFLHRYDDIA